MTVPRLHMPRSVHKIKLMQRLREQAAQLGFNSVSELLHEWYFIDNVSVYEMCSRLTLDRYTLRKIMDDLQIPTKPKGGANNVKLVITNEMINEVSTYGISDCARRWGVSYELIYRQLREWSKKKQKEQKNDLLGES